MAINYKAYLPSKDFQKKVLACLVILAIILLIFFGAKFIKKGIQAYTLKKRIKELPVELRSQVDVLTLGELQKKDSNSNGVADWEERLYGLDPLVAGEENKKIVEEKRESLRSSAEFNPTDAPQGETQEFTRELLSAVMSLQASGALNDGTLQSIAASIGGKFVPVSTQEIYTDARFTRIRDSKITNDNYRRQAAEAVDKLPALGVMGEEINFLAESLQSNDPLLLAPLDNIANSYKSFADALVKIPVPDSLFNDHKALVNSAAYISKSLTMIQKVNTDPMTAIQGMAIYNTHFQIMDKSLDNLAQELDL